MATIFLISDTHFGHENIIRYCNRPFATAEEMDEIMIARWNAIVRPSDHVWHLGDVAMSETAFLRCVPRLQGKLRLVLGNHDHQVPMRTILQYFEKVRMWRLFKPFILTHAPLHPESFGKASWNIHGHTHEQPAYPGGYINVSVEHTNYTPVALDDVAKQAGERVIY